MSISLYASPVRGRFLMRLALLAALGTVFVLRSQTAFADSCDECEKQCETELKDCKKAAPKILCKVPGIKGVCTMFRNAQCPASREICRSFNCGLIPGCNLEPGGGGVSGDPHFYSLDRARFDLQPAGEFLIAQSESAKLEVQARFVPWRSNGSVIKMLGVRTAGKVISFQADVGIRIDAKLVEVQQESYRVAAGITLARGSDGQYLLSIGANQLWVRVGSFLDFRIVPDSKTEGSWQGLLGNFDGDHENDIQTRSGKVLAHTSLKQEALYKEFAESWRLLQKESFLFYEEGENTETFTDRSFPKSHLSVAQLDQRLFTKAHTACVRGGVRHGEAMHNCIYDYAVSGDDAFIKSYTATNYLEAAVAIFFPGSFALRAQSSGYQGEFMPVFWSIAEAGDAKVVIRGAGGENMSSAWAKESNPLMIRLPATVGSYVIEFIQGDNKIEQAIEVRTAMASITAPATVEGAAEFEISWQGPLGRGDYVALAQAGEEDPRQYLRYKWAGHSDKTFQAPAKPGVYQLWYVLQGAQSRSIIARTTIEVSPSQSSITSLEEVVAGSFIHPTWTGPDGQGDFLDLVVKGSTDTSKQISYDWTSKADNVKLRAPIEPGNYDLRYIADTAAGRAILTRQTVVVKDTEAVLHAPKIAKVGELMEFTWQGPNHTNDYIAFTVQGESDPHKHLSYIWAHEGSGKLRAPATPGTYDLFYILQGAQKRRILARSQVLVK